MPTSDVTTAKHSKPKSAVPLVAPAVAKGKRGPIAKAAAQTVRPEAAGPETRQLMIAEAAYYLAEKRAFAPGGELQDWLEAEAAMEVQYPV